MNRTEPSVRLPRPAKVAAAAVAVVIALLPHVSAQESSIHSDTLFELGDGVDPAIPGIADILGSEQPGPDWDDLFNADRTLKDEYDEFGAPGSNGVPDFLDTFGAVRLRRDASFIFDDISAGTAIDGTAWIDQGVVGTAVVPSSQDLGNTYAYNAFNNHLESVLYLGAERLAAGDGRIAFELNRVPFSLASDGTLLGERTIADLKVDAIFSGGILTAVEVRSWELVDPEGPVFDWILIENLPVTPDQSAEQCNAAGIFCVVCNGVGVSSGSWPSYDAAGSPVTILAPDSFIEIGINLTRLLGYHTYENYYATRFVGLQVSTDADYASGIFARAGRAAGAEQPAS